MNNDLERAPLQHDRHTPYTGETAPDVEQRTIMPDARRQESASKPHRIDVYTVGIPGEQKLVADTTTGNQVGVRYFDSGDIVAIKRIIIEEAEKAALESARDKPIEEQEAMAKETMKDSRQEAEDIGRLAELFNDRKDAILVVDSASVHHTSGEHKSLDLLVCKSDLQAIGELLGQLGYSTNDVGGTGMEAVKGRCRFFFIYAKECAGKEEVGLDPETETIEIVH